MNETIDYNALNWVREELDKVLRQARSFLDEYAGNRSDTACLQVSAKNLHQARGPLQMVGLKGADQLACEMEEVIADLLHGTLRDDEKALEVLMQAFLQLPDYLSRLHSGKTYAPAVLLPVINSLREVRNVPVLEESTVFSPDLAVSVPSEIYSARMTVSDKEIQTRARAARLKFQTGLLEWYRGNEGNAGLQILHSVFGQMLQDAGRESAARLWWVADTITEAMIEGEMEATNGLKQLYGRIDRQIKRFIDMGESVFDDPLSDELMIGLLYCIANTESSMECMESVKATYRLGELLEGSIETAAIDDSLTGCSEDLLQTVAMTATEDIERIKDLLDIFTRGNGDEPGVLLPVADELHALGNMLNMVGIDQFGNTVAEKVRLIRSIAAGDSKLDQPALVGLANLLVAVEDAIKSLGSCEFSKSSGAGRMFLKEGVAAVIREAAKEMAGAKEAIVEFIRVPGSFEMLEKVPGQLSRVRGSLQLSGHERAAIAVGQIGQFIAVELVEHQHPVDDDQLELLADAVCSVEYFIEESSEGGTQGDRVLSMAEESLAALGYTCPVLSPEDEQTVYGQDDLPEQQGSFEEDMVTDALPDKSIDSLETPVITDLQIIDTGADEEILAIFIEEVDEVQAQFGSQLPAWLAALDETAPLLEVRRGMHTIKGSGRMVGALALGEFAWVFENLLNRVIDGTVEPGSDMRELVQQAVPAIEQLLAQVKDSATKPVADVNAIACKAMMLSQPGKPLEESSGEPAATQNAVGQHTDEQHTDEQQADEQQADERQTDERQADELQPVAQSSLSGIPVLAEEADPEILEIFLEEASEEIASLSGVIPKWVGQPDNSEQLATIRRSLHTLKGSGRMAGAMVMGEFSWALENLVNRMIDDGLEAGEAVYGLLGRVPDALQQLFVQLREGTAPDLDIEEMITHAEALACGETIEPAAVSDNVPDESPVEDLVSTPENQAAEDAQEEDQELLEIFTKECSEHLLVIEKYLASSQSPCTVTEALYRSLHTISGITDSSCISSIDRLANVLDGYFDGLYQGQHLAGADALEVLKDSTAEMKRLINQLPDMSFDENVQNQLCARVESLPQTGVAQAADDPYSSIDSELLEVFIEEASEIIDAGENTLRDWSAEPANQDLMAEFQRQLHTLKGGARMVGIIPIGDLSHTLESLLARVAEGQVEATPDLFIMLHDSHDHLAEMLEHVKVRELPVDAGKLKTVIEGMGLESGVAGDADPVDSHADSEDQPLPAGEAQHDADAGAEATIELEDELEQEPEITPEVEAVEEQVSEADSRPESEVVKGPETETGPMMEAPATGDQPAAGTSLEADEIKTVPAKFQRVYELPLSVEQRDNPHVRSEQVRVRAELLDNLVNYAGEINIYRARMEQQISDYRYNLGELDQTIGRLREQLRQVEIETEAHILFRYEQEGESAGQDFDPLEMDRYSNLQQLSRSLIESIGDLCSIQGLMENTTRQAETLLLQQSRVSTELQDGLLHTRMIPFSGIAPRLQRIIRQSARELGKKVELDFEGADGEMDRTVIDRIIAPLEHMLRNAIAHGIENPAVRKEAGKPAVGSVTISFEREGSEIVLCVKDDGAGLDIEAIRARAIERNLLDTDADLPDSDIMQFVLQTGFSTATEVTQISGRGVGMDVVNGEVKQLGGSLHIASVAGEGTIFTVRLPYTLASNQALLVKAGEETFCMPLGSIEGVARMSPGQLSECYQEHDGILEYAGNRYQLKHLGSLLGCGGMEQGMQQSQVPILLTRIGEKRVAFQLESILGSREIVIKPLGAQLSNVDGISGATILGDGRVVLILDLMSISRMQAQNAVPEMTAPSRGDQRLHVMVVDDSITVRKVTTRLLERNGFRVLTAKDGVDALGLLQDNVPDVMLLDIEMPRMDGFELATHMRNDERLKHVPIIMITSRTGDKHREHAKQIGVNDYLGKPYQETQLLDSIHSMIDVSKTEECA